MEGCGMNRYRGCDSCPCVYSGDNEYIESKMDGLEMLKKLKSKKATKNIPVIVMSNLASDEDIREALSQGAVKHIVKKDYGPREVINVVKEVLSGNVPKETLQTSKTSD